MFKTTYRGVLQHPVRFLLSVIAVVLGVAFITGVFALRTSLADTFSSITESGYTADVYVRGAAISGQADTAASTSASGGGSHQRIPTSLADRIAKVPGVKHVTPSMQGSGVLVGSNGTAVTTSGAPTLFLGMDPGEPRGSLTLVRGHAPTGDDEIVLEQHAMKQSGWKIGDTATIIVANQVKQARVVGEVKYSAAGMGVLLVGVSPQFAMQQFNPDGTVASLAVYGDGGQSQQDRLRLARSVARALSDGGSVKTQADAAGYAATAVDGTTGGVVVNTVEKMQAETNETINQVLGFVSTFLLVFAVLALFVGAFIIANTFTQSVKQRTREFAVLRAIGASPAQVFTSVVLQSVIVGFAGSLLGLAGGVGLIALVRQALAAVGSQLSTATPIDGQTVTVAIVTGVAVTVLASLAPARTAAEVPPVAAMQEESGPEKPLTWRGIVGSAMIAGGVVCTIWAAALGDGAGPLLGLGAGLVLIGALVALPLAVSAVTAVIGWPFRVLLPPLGALAQGNVHRNPRRSASTASALMIGMALVGAAAVLASSTTASVAAIVSQSMKSDYIVQSATYQLPAGFQQEVERLSDVKRVDVLTYGFGPGQIRVGGKSMESATLTPGALDHSLAAPALEGTSSALDRGEALVQKTPAKDNHWKVGDRLQLTSADGSVTRTVRVGGILDDTSFIGVPITLDQTTFNALIPLAQQRHDNALFITGASGVSKSSLHSQLVRLAKPYYVLSIMDQQQFVSNRADQVQSVLGILYALLAMSIVIAILGIVNTLALSIIERTREIGLMRAVGLGRLQLAVTITIESVVIAVFGAAVGLLIGVGVASALPSVLSSSGLSALAIPWGQLGGFLLLSALVGVLAAVVPAIRAARLPVLKAIVAE